MIAWTQPQTWLKQETEEILDGVAAIKSEWSHFTLKKAIFAFPNPAMKPKYFILFRSDETAI